MTGRMFLFIAGSREGPQFVPDPQQTLTLVDGAFVQPGESGVINSPLNATVERYHKENTEDRRDIEEAEEIYVLEGTPDEDAAARLKQLLQRYTIRGADRQPE